MCVEAIYFGWLLYHGGFARGHLNEMIVQVQPLIHLLILSTRIEMHINYAQIVHSLTTIFNHPPPPRHHRLTDPRNFYSSSYFQLIILSK